MDLLIRTSGRTAAQRLPCYGNALTPRWCSPSGMWPTFTGEDLAEAVNEFHRRDRRFGRVASPISNENDARRTAQASRARATLKQAMDFLFSGESWAALLTLTLLEIVLGIDNIVFISILAGKLPADQRQRARTVGLGLAMGTRILLLLSLTWIMRLTRPLLTIGPQEVSGRDLILLLGGMFLLWKSTHEIHERLEGDAEETVRKAKGKANTMASVLTQIALLDIVFSLDSVITAVGMAKEVSIMIAAIVISVGIMMWASGPLGDFVERHPTIKMLALSFLLLIGMALVAEGFHQHIPKGYIYFAMGFSVFVEMLNLRARRSSRSKK